jgi:hypothetical protein
MLIATEDVLASNRNSIGRSSTRASGTHRLQRFVKIRHYRQDVHRSVKQQHRRSLGIQWSQRPDEGWDIDRDVISAVTTVHQIVTALKRVETADE